MKSVNVFKNDPSNKIIERIRCGLLLPMIAVSVCHAVQVGFAA